MKTCSKGHNVPDNEIFCPVDGERIPQGIVGVGGVGVSVGGGGSVGGGSGGGGSGGGSGAGPTPNLLFGLLGGAVILWALISFVNKPTTTPPPVNTPIPSHTLTITETVPEILVDLTSTEVPTSTNMPTSTTSPTKTAVPVSKNKSGSCPGAIKQLLEVNEDAEICTKKDPVRLRSKPDKDSSIVDRLYPGIIVWVVDGPICADGASFWMVRTKSGTTGWMMEGLGDNEDPYYLCPN